MIWGGERKNRFSFTRDSFCENSGQRVPKKLWLGVIRDKNSDRENLSAPYAPQDEIWSTPYCKIQGQFWEELSSKVVWSHA